ncbi:NAD-dependent epimerase/dehydratase family protein [Hyphomonas sp.]|uniref:NAD-dependent epimerase/dehydratase family protein n=1 Tax=Hyphomonas sp. TaxID=87 RepID=UPI0030F813F8
MNIETSNSDRSSKTENVLVTGAAGFVGYSVSLALLERGINVIGVDNLNDYYPFALKQARLERLNSHAGFTFHRHDISDHTGLLALPGVNDVDIVIHLAAQAGVRYSLENPFVYATSNLVGHLSILELVRRAPKHPLLVYASSSSVYGANTKVPFSESDPVNSPVSLYAATKRADELMSESYARLYGMRQIGLRFFTVYGPWGRPDMAYWSFAEKILSGEPIKVFNHGKLERDFTYIDDVVAGVIATALQPMKPQGDVPHRIYNIGNNTPVQLMRFIEILEQTIGKKAQIQFEPMQPGDVHSTYADISAIAADYGFSPSTPLETGIPVFVDWFRAYSGKPAKS